jgi:fumarylpyruvate hydrolase
MHDYIFPPAAQVTVPVKGTDALFPVRRIYCIGRNYADHAIEMGHDPTREAPFFFQKNPQNIRLDGTFPYPSRSRDVHHEVELVVALDGGGRDIAEAEALELVFGYGVGLDMTRRDLQGEAKKTGRPWEVGKAFEHSAPMAPLVPVAEYGHPRSGRISLSVNGVVRQDGDLGQMIWSVAEIIACLSRFYELAPGDLILTGTPAGVGPVQRGDLLEAKIDGLGVLAVRVT